MASKTVCKTICPFCVWTAGGLLLLLTVPGLGSAQTVIGPSLLWLLLVPFCSAVLRRGFTPPPQIRSIRP